MENCGLISVIIPVYNVERYLRECISSVLNQTYQNFEIVLVDDGSKDRSPEICDEFAASDPRIRCIHKENGGASTARNVGLDYAKGEYLFFLDSDDWLDDHTFEKLLTPLQNTEMDFSFCEAYAVDEDTGKISLTNYGYHRNYGTGNAQSMFSEMVERREFHVAVWMLLYRREFLQKNGLRFVEKIMYEDCIYAYQAYKQAKLAAHVHEYLYYRRYRKGSVMTSKKTAHNFVSAKCAFEGVVSSWKQYGAEEADQPYVARIAHNAIQNYWALPSEDRERYKAEFGSVRQSILDNGGFSDESLTAVCHGKPAWVMYKLAGKILHWK